MYFPRQSPQNAMGARVCRKNNFFLMFHPFSQEMGVLVKTFTGPPENEKVYRKRLNNYRQSFLDDRAHPALFADVKRRRRAETHFPELVSSRAITSGPTVTCTSSETSKVSAVSRSRRGKKLSQLGGDHIRLSSAPQGKRRLNENTGPGKERKTQPIQLTSISKGESTTFLKNTDARVKIFHFCPTPLPPRPLLEAHDFYTAENQHGGNINASPSGSIKQV